MKKILTVFTMVALLFALILPIQGQPSVTNFTNLKVAHDLTVGDDLVVTGDTDLNGDIDFNNDVSYSADVSYTPQTTITVTMNGWITPTGALQLVSAAGAVSLSGGHLAAGSQGQLLTLVNVGAQTITITETTGLISAGNVALGALDTATFIYRLSNWYQVAASNN